MPSTLHNFASEKLVTSIVMRLTIADLTSHMHNTSHLPLFVFPINICYIECCRCSVCHKAFSQTSILQSHMAMHLNQRAHLCNQCGKSFRQKSQLRLHEQRHAGLRKYQCTLCQFKFLTKGDKHIFLKNLLNLSAVT